MRNAISLLFLLAPLSLPAQIRVNPTGVNVNTQGASTAFLTFGGLQNHVPVEAFWCGRLLPAAPARGNRCDPATLFGQLPLRYDRSRVIGTTFTDIMSIPAAVTRRAYEAALAGDNSSFFYVRRFRSTTGGPDEYVAVTCRLAGGGARVPFALTNVDVHFQVETPVLFVAPGEPPPPINAEILYNGTGRLRGRWEIVLPGEQLPSSNDLLTEASLPAGERGLQKRYTQLERFNVFLPPTGRVTLPGPDPAKLPATLEGQYLVLLRVEASDDKEADSNLGAVGAGQGVLHNGAVAGFPMPTLRYVVGAGDSRLVEARATETVGLLLPAAGSQVARDSALSLVWVERIGANYYRLELENVVGTEALFSAVVESGVGSYHVPAFALANAKDHIRWRVVALDARGRELGRSEWRALQLRKTP